MNKNKISRKKLMFNKQTIANLNGPLMNRVVGGVLATAPICTGNCESVHHPDCLAWNISEPECPPVESQEPGVVCPSQEPGCPPTDTVWETCPVTCVPVVV